MADFHRTPNQPEGVEWYEQAVTRVSGLLTQYIKDAGGYRTAEGSKLGHLLHEVNGAFGNVYSLVELLKMRIDDLERTAVEGSSLGDRLMLERLLHEERMRRESPQDRKAWNRGPTEVDEALAKKIIEAGWVGPSDVSRLSRADHNNG